MDSTNEKAREGRLRRLAKRNGLRLEKSRGGGPDFDRKFMLLDEFDRRVINCDLTIDEVTGWLEHAVQSA